VKVLIVAAVLVALVRYFPLLWTFIWVAQDEYRPFNRSRMERIVDGIKHQNFTGDRIFVADKAGNVEVLPLQTRSQDFGDGSELMIVDQSGDEKEAYAATDDLVASHPGMNVCWGRRAPDGVLSVTVVIVNDGDEGDEFGFAYSDAPLVKLKTSAPYGYCAGAVDLPGPLVVPTSGIENHWWRVLGVFPWS
jgi:hypothetical protein